MSDLILGLTVNEALRFARKRGACRRDISRIEALQVASGGAWDAILESPLLYEWAVWMTHAGPPAQRSILPPAASLQLLSLRQLYWARVRALDNDEANASVDRVRTIEALHAAHMKTRVLACLELGRALARAKLARGEALTEEDMGERPAQEKVNELLPKLARALDHSDGDVEALLQTLPSPEAAYVERVWRSKRVLRRRLSQADAACKQICATLIAGRASLDADISRLLARYLRVSKETVDKSLFAD